MSGTIQPIGSVGGHGHRPHAGAPGITGRVMKDDHKGKGSPEDKRGEGKGVPVG